MFTFPGIVENVSVIEPTTSAAPPKDLVIAHGVGIGVFASLKGLAAVFPEAILSCFSLPAAWLASLFLSAPLHVTPEGEVFLCHPAIEIAVTSACSGFTFFTLLCALSAGFACARFSARRWFRDAPVLLLTAYALAILANSFRMVCAVQIRLFTSRWIPESYGDSIHMTVGMIVFLPVLFSFWIYLQRFYEPKNS